MPTSRRQLHAFDVRSVLLFASLTLGGTAAVMAQDQGTPSSSTASATAKTTTATLGRCSASSRESWPSTCPAWPRSSTNGTATATASCRCRSSCNTPNLRAERRLRPGAQAAPGPPLGECGPSRWRAQRPRCRWYSFAPVLESAT